MPLEPLDETPSLLSRLDAPSQPETADEVAASDIARPAFVDTMQAAFRTQNEFGSVMAREDTPDPYEVEAGFSSYDYVKGTPNEGSDAFLDVFNRKAADALTRQIDREKADRRTLDASGPLGMVAEVAAGMASPTLLLPGGAIYRGVKGGYAIGRTALSASTAAVAATAAQEAVLQGTQETRTASETGFALGASALLGGFLGGGAAALLSKGERKAAERAVRILSLGEEPGPGGSAVGAAPVMDIGPGDLDIAGRAASAVANATAQMNPVLRLNTSPAQSSRLVGQGVGENSIYQAGNDAGVTPGPAVERLAVNNFNARIYAAERALDESYKAMRKAGIPMSRVEFEDAAGRAARRNDIGENEYVTAAAKAYRTNVLDPYKDEAIAEKLLAADVKTTTADSYLHRQWDFQRLTAGERKFKTIVRGWAKVRAAEELERFNKQTDRRVQNLTREVEELEINKLRRATEAKERRMVGGEADLAPEGVRESDIVQAINMVRGRAPKPKVETITSFLSTKGGLVDLGGELASRGITNRTRPGFVRKELARRNLKGGLGLDEAALQAWEAGFFPGRSSRPSINELLDALEDDFTKRRVVVRQSDQEAVRLYELMGDVEADLARLGVGDVDTLRFTTSDKLKDMVDRINMGLDLKADEKIANLKARAKDIEAEANQTRTVDFDAFGDFDEYADEITNLVYNKLTGRMAEEGVPALGQLKLGPRGPLKERTFDIPDALVEEFLNNNIMEVGRRYARLMGADVELTRRFGAVDMAQQKLEIQDEYAALRARVEASESLDQIREITGKGFIWERAKRKAAAEKSAIDPSIAMEEELKKLGPNDPLREPLGIATGIGLKQDLAEITSAIDAARAAGRTDILEEIVSRYESNAARAAESKPGVAADNPRYETATARLAEIAADSAKLADDVRAASGLGDGKSTVSAAGVDDNARVKEKALAYLAKRERSDLSDIEDMRDLVRGTFGIENADGAWTRISRAANHVNYITKMGGVVVASIGDIFRPAMVHGLGAYMNDGIRPLLTAAGREAVKMSIEDARLFGLVVERYTQGRLATFAEIADPYRSGTAVERLLDKASRVGSRWNGILIWNDAMKGISSVMSQNRILRAVAGGTDERFLAYLGINPAMKARIAGEVAKHAEELDGIMIGRVSRWEDVEAARVYGAALGKDVDSIIVTKSVGDTPVFANTPAGRMILQFKSFMFASHQKVLLRGLQESPARFASGLAGMTALGMMAAYARAWRGGHERFEKFQAAAENPGYLIGEALDLTGIFALPMEAANIGEKILQTNVVKDPLKAVFPSKSQQGSSLRYQSRGVAATLMGPSAGLIDIAAETAKLTALAASGEATGSQKKRLYNQAVQLVPYYSYPGMREMVNLLRPEFN